MKKKIFLITAIIFILVLCLVSCNESYKITFDLNGGTMANEYEMVKFEKNYSLPIPQRLGYKFIGWYYNDTRIDDYGIWQYEADMELVAKWEFSHYVITYELNGGIADNITAYTAESETFTIYPPTKENTIFSHWIDENGKIYEGEIIIPKGSEGNLSLTAIWWDGVAENGVKYAFDGITLSVVGFVGDFGTSSNSLVSFTIQSELFGVPVTRIEEGAFEGLATKVANFSYGYFTIYIPDSITYIGKNAFNNCAGIRVLIKLPEGTRYSTENCRNKTDEWLEYAVVEEEGNEHLIDSMKLIRAAIGWSPYTGNQ